MGCAAAWAPASVEAYVLFVKVGSDKYVGKWHALIELPEGDCFEDMVRLRGRQGNRRENKIISSLAEANDLKCMIDAGNYSDED